MAQTIITQPTRFRYEEAYRKFQTKAYPSASKDYGFLNTKYPDTRTANGLTIFILNFLKWEGHRATRISTAGRVVKGRYIPGGTRKGTADVSATIKGRAVMWEIKIGADKPSEFQIREQQLEKEAGGEYFFVKTPDEFLMQYDQFLLSLSNGSKI